MDTSKKLYRSRTKRVFAGVCGGLSDYLGIDVTLLRILAIIIPGVNLVTYLILAVIMPEEPAS